MPSHQLGTRVGTAHALGLGLPHEAHSRGLQPRSSLPSQPQRPEAVLKVWPGHAPSEAPGEGPSCLSQVAVAPAGPGPAAASLQPLPLSLRGLSLCLRVFFCLL